MKLDLKGRTQSHANPNYINQVCNQVGAWLIAFIPKARAWLIAATRTKSNHMQLLCRVMYHVPLHPHFGFGVSRYSTKIRARAGGVPFRWLWGGRISSCFVEIGGQSCGWLEAGNQVQFEFVACCCCVGRVGTQNPAVIAQELARSRRKSGRALGTDQPGHRLWLDIWQGTYEVARASQLSVRGAWCVVRGEQYGPPGGRARGTPSAPGVLAL
jgi:hypothetical protein